MSLQQPTKKPAGAFEINSRRQREAAPKVARALIVLIASFLVFAVIWSANTEMRVLVRAEGEISPVGELRRVDHFDGGVVAEILVRVGAVVAANQPLARIVDPSLQSEITELTAELAYLNKQITNTTWLLGGENKEGVSPATEALRKLFFARQEMMKHRNEKLAENVEISSSLLENARDHLAHSEAALGRIQLLHERGVVSQSGLLLQIEETAGIRADFFRADAAYSKAKLDASEANAAKDEAYLAFQEEHLDALNDLERSRDLVQVKLNGLMAQKGRQVILAPESGVIQASFATTVGEVVPPGATLFELLPSGERLVAVVKIDPKDVGHIEEGSDAVVKVTTFDARRYGEVRGAIELISPTSIVPDNAAAYYKAVLSLESDSVGNSANAKRLRAGMTLNAEIETSKRTVLSYLLKPVQNAFGRSLTER